MALNRRNVLVGVGASAVAAIVPFSSFAHAPIRIEQWPVYDPADGFFPVFDHIVHSIVEWDGMSHFTAWGLWKNADCTDVMFIYASREIEKFQGRIKKWESRGFVADVFLEMDHGEPLSNAARTLFSDFRVHSPHREWAYNVIDPMATGVETGMTASAHNALNYLAREIKNE